MAVAKSRTREATSLMVSPGRAPERASAKRLCSWWVVPDLIATPQRDGT